MSDRSSTPNMADIQRQWWEMAEAASRPWQEAAKAFAEPWRELSESFGARTDFPNVGQESWERFTAAFSTLAEQQQRIAEAIFEAMRTGAEEMQRAMEQAVEQMAAFARGVSGGGDDAETPAPATGARKATKSSGR
jgi:hypothetical protein